MITFAIASLDTKKLAQYTLMWATLPVIGKTVTGTFLFLVYLVFYSSFIQGFNN